jgi:micrococcal nuclease
MIRCVSYSRVLPLLFALLLAPLSSLPACARDQATITRVVDGDTLEITLTGKTEKVRLIGVDTPEKFESGKLHRDAARSGQDETTIQALGKQASDFTKSLVHPGDAVQLEYGQEPRDKYHRLLAFVWLSDGRMLNETIVCEGYSNAYTRYPFRPDYMDRFRTCEGHAREQGKGLWGEGLAAPASAAASQPASAAEGEIKGNRRSMVYHLPTCPDYGRISAKNVVPFTTEAEAAKAGYHKAKNCP